eukprot:tig00000498_g1600.t1
MPVTPFARFYTIPSIDRRPERPRRLHGPAGVQRLRPVSSSPQRQLSPAPFPIVPRIPAAAYLHSYSWLLDSRVVERARGQDPPIAPLTRAPGHRIAHARADNNFGLKLVLRAMQAGTSNLTARAAVDLLSQPRFSQLQKLQLQIEDNGLQSAKIPAILQVVLAAPPCARLESLYVERVVRTKFGEEAEALAGDDLLPVPALVPALKEIGVSGRLAGPLRPLAVPGNRIERVAFAAGDESLRLLREWFPRCREVGLVDLGRPGPLARARLCAHSLSLAAPDWTRPEDALDLAQCVKAGTRRLRLAHTGPRACERGGAGAGVPPSTDAAHGALLAALAPEAGGRLESLSLKDFPWPRPPRRPLPRLLPPPPRPPRLLAPPAPPAGEAAPAPSLAGPLAEALTALPRLSALVLDRVPGLPAHFPAVLRARCPRLREISFSLPEAPGPHKPASRFAAPSLLTAFA